MGQYFYLLDRMRNAIVEKSDDIDVVYNMRFFDVISNLTLFSFFHKWFISFAGLIYKLTGYFKSARLSRISDFSKVSDVLKKLYKNYWQC